jgi:hypothetical protein
MPDGLGITQDVGQKILGLLRRDVLGRRLGTIASTPNDRIPWGPAT